MPSLTPEHSHGAIHDALRCLPGRGSTVSKSTDQADLNNRALVLRPPSGHAKRRSRHAALAEGLGAAPPCRGGRLAVQVLYVKSMLNAPSAGELAS